MLTPEKIQALGEPIEDIYAKIVDELLINIGRHITSPAWTHTASWEIQKLSELGQLTAENAAIINRWIKQIPAATRATMEVTRAAALDRIEKELERAAAAGYVTPPVSDGTVRVLSELGQQAADRYNLVNSNMLNSSVEIYQQAIIDTAATIAEAETRNRELLERAGKTAEAVNIAAASTAGGEETRRDAIRKAIKKISDEGLTGFVDRGGRHWTPEAYVNMVTRSTVHNTAVQSVKERMSDFNTQVFQVSAHAGARPGCYPFQGKFYSWDDSAGEIELGNGRRVRYEPLSVTTYGEPAGLFGINCRHSPIPIIPGVTIPHAQDFVQDREANKKAYEESQEQRAIERAIREAKRVVAMEGDLATDEQKAEVRKMQAKMREFIKHTGRTRRPDREQIGG